VDGLRVLQVPAVNNECKQFLKQIVSLQYYDTDTDKEIIMALVDENHSKRQLSSIPLLLVFCSGL